MHQQGLRNVSSRPVPDGQKYAPGTRVRIADDLGHTMSHFRSGCLATVQYTYAHAYGGDNVRSYSLDIDGHGSVSWYQESQLTPVEYPKLRAARDIQLKSGEEHPIVQDGTDTSYDSRNIDPLPEPTN